MNSYDRVAKVVGPKKIKLLAESGANSWGKSGLVNISFSRFYQLSVNIEMRFNTPAHHTIFSLCPYLTALIPLMCH